jgi:hypothetical protein
MMSQADEGAKLAKIFGFDTAALNANREGRMTAPQRRKVLRRGGMAVVGRAVQTLVTGAACGALIYLDAPMLILLFGLILLGLPGLLFAESTCSILLAVLADLRTGEVRVAPSRVKHARHTRTLYVERTIFRNVTRAEYNAFRSRGRYRVYYAARSKVILSAETVAADAPIPDSWRHSTDNF